MIYRKQYLEQLSLLRNSAVIKVITGIRRCGKSFLLQQYYDVLVKSGVVEGQILLVNFESLKYDAIVDYKDLYNFVKEKVDTTKKIYLLLDEIQRVVAWEKALASFQVDFDCDVYITGSNAYLLSSELSTYLAGRYVEIHVLPLSFFEYFTSGENESKQEMFDRYARFGGFPGLLEIPDHQASQRNYLEGIYSTVIVKDIISRCTVKDVDLLNRILRYLLDNIGNLVSANKIADYLTSNGRKTPASTVVDYLAAYANAFVLYRARRYRIKGKHIMQSPDKYYVVDVGLRQMMNGFESLDTGRVLENIVYLELIRRGYQVFVVADTHFEVDFIAMRGEEKKYFQVTWSVADAQVKERELKGFMKINDNHPKILLSMDYILETNIDGVIHQNMIDFLLSI